MFYLFILILLIFYIAGFSLYLKQRVPECKEALPKKDITANFGLPKDDLPTYRRADLDKHGANDKQVWVTFKDGVYDVTDFVGSHPGGKKILLAGGKSLEPFFATYAQHMSEHVLEMMEELRIGNLHPDDKEVLKAKDLNDPFANDPARHPVLSINSEKPFNAEPPAELLTDNFLTPNDLFFVRNHLPVPKVDAKTHKIEIFGDGWRRPMVLSVDQLKQRFRQHTITAAVQCAGNRRSQMAKYKGVKGLSWGMTAISNAEWTGVKLSDVLIHAGIREEDVEHVTFSGKDTDIENAPYAASIPAATAFDPRKDVLLAFEMNGEPLPVDHGFPIRVIAPGIAGARQVKWLTKITASKEECQGHWQQNDYKQFNPSIDWHNVDFRKAVAIQEYPIQSAICEPEEGSTLEDAEEVTLKGYAWSGGGRGIIRVDVSLDSGKNWEVAELHSVKQQMHREWAWTLWEAQMKIPESMRGKKLDLVCKAVDTSHNAQPETAEGIWNLRGLIHNSWHHVNVSVPKR